MAQYHLLDPRYDESHRGRLVAEGQVRTKAVILRSLINLWYVFGDKFHFDVLQVPPLLRPRAHGGFLEMAYDDRYTHYLSRAGLDVVSFQVRRGLPPFNAPALTALVDRYVVSTLIC